MLVILPGLEVAQGEVNNIWNIFMTRSFSSSSVQFPGVVDTVAIGHARGQRTERR